MLKLVIIIVVLKFASASKICITPRDKFLNFTELTSAAGYHSDVYQTTTEDGYILTLFNIPGNKTKPVLIMHGVLNTADSFVVLGNDSMGIALANQGYDVWIGNYRGNRYNRCHITLDPTDAQFWNFTFHEIGYYDLPANIDFILNKTSQTQLSAIGFSLGTTIFYILGSTRPEYNAKINILISLAPVAYFTNVQPPVSTFINMESFLARLTHNRHELFAPNSREKALTLLCMTPAGFFICKRMMAELTGAADEDITPDFFNILYHRYPDSVSRKLARHLAQLKNNFSQYDYGVKNLQVYNSSEPPVYNLSNCVIKTALFVGARDRLSVSKDVELLRNKLPNVVEYRTIGQVPFSHVNFIWLKNNANDLFVPIFELLDKYS